ncbi:MAG TPA: GNAT family N-acetyltransferase [Actinomycetota bacterium]|nr:GNAT family N-acetyltransferase [Actinomycetota bacterium]
MSSRPAGGGPIPSSQAALPPGVTVRPARPGDARGWMDHVREVAAERRFIRTEEVRWSVRDLRRRFRRSWTVHNASLVAVGDGRVLGTLGLEREGNPVLRHIASLGMAVDRDWRGKGLGTALLAEAFRWAEWAGVEKLTLTVYPHNEPAINLYKKFGFVEEGRLIGQSKKSYGYEDEIVMGRWL